MAIRTELERTLDWTLFRLYLLLPEGGSCAEREKRRTVPIRLLLLLITYFWLGLHTYLTANVEEESFTP